MAVMFLTAEGVVSSQATAAGRSAWVMWDKMVLAGTERLWITRFAPFLGPRDS